MLLNGYDAWLAERGGWAQTRETVICSGAESECRSCPQMHTWVKCSSVKKHFRRKWTREENSSQRLILREKNLEVTLTCRSEQEQKPFNLKTKKAVCMKNGPSDCPWCKTSGGTPILSKSWQVCREGKWLISVRQSFAPSSPISSDQIVAVSPKPWQKPRVRRAGTVTVRVTVACTSFQTLRIDALQKEKNKTVYHKAQHSEASF